MVESLAFDELNVLFIDDIFVDFHQFMVETFLHVCCRMSLSSASFPLNFLNRSKSRIARCSDSLFFQSRLEAAGFDY